MAEGIRLAVLGGSGVATPQLIQALAEREDRRPTEVVLIGRTADKLERVAALCVRLAEGARVSLRVRHTTDQASGLEGADYVLNQIRVGGYKARAFDETFPQAYGIPGEETFGPGGMANALRTVPVTLEACRIIEQVAPRALLINLANPSSYVQYAVTRYSQVEIVGVCDSPASLAHAVAAAVGAPPEEVWVGYVGMHHFGWVTEARWRGRDILPEVLARLEEFPGLPVDADLVRAMGAIPTSYFKYYYHPDRMLAKQKGKPTRADQLLELEGRILADYEDPDLRRLPESLESRGAGWYKASIVPVMLAHANDSHSIFTLNLRNGTTLPWMPAEAIIEVPTLVTRQGFYPLQPPPAPPDIQAMLRRNAACEMLWVEAIVERSYDKALRAMTLNHLVHSLDQARDLLREIWPR
jgi:6-phospho-beta-glucosidase